MKDVVENIDPDAVAGWCLNIRFMLNDIIIHFIFPLAGIGFDATCSLVALDNEDKPITVSPTGKRPTIKFMIQYEISTFQTLFLNT